MLKLGCGVLTAWALLNLVPSGWIAVSILTGEMNAPGLYALLNLDQVRELPPDVRASANSIGVFANGLNVAYSVLFLGGIWLGLARREEWLFWPLVVSALFALLAGVGADVVVGGSFLWMNMASALFLAVGFTLCRLDRPSQRADRD